MQAATSIDDGEYVLRKRLPPRSPLRFNDVYVSEKTNFKAQESKCQKLLDQGNEVIIHGLGKAINRAINLALQLKDKGVGTVQLCVQTSTLELTDDLIPETDDGDAKTATRSNSTIHIRVYRELSDDKSEKSSMAQKSNVKS